MVKLEIWDGFITVGNDAFNLWEHQLKEFQDIWNTQLSQHKAKGILQYLNDKTTGEFNEYHLQFIKDSNKNGAYLPSKVIYEMLKSLNHFMNISDKYGNTMDYSYDGFLNYHYDVKNGYRDINGKIIYEEEW